MILYGCGWTFLRMFYGIIPWWLRWRIFLQCRTPGFDSWVRKIPWRREWQPSSVFLPGESQGQRNSMELQRVRYNWATHTHTHTHTSIKGHSKDLLGLWAKPRPKPLPIFSKWDLKFFFCIALLFCDQRIPCSWYNIWKLQINFKKPKSGIYSPTSYC